MSKTINLSYETIIASYNANIDVERISAKHGDAIERITEQQQ